MNCNSVTIAKNTLRLKVVTIANSITMSLANVTSNTLDTTLKLA